MAVVRTSFVGTSPLTAEAALPPLWEAEEAPERTTAAEPPMAPRRAEVAAVSAPMEAPTSLGRALPDPSLRAFGGLVVGVADMNESAERDIVSAAGGRAVLCAYGGFDPTRRPVVLVHGNDDSPERLTALAAELDAVGMQVMLLYYDDRGRALPDNAADLAVALQALRPSFPRGWGVDIVGHSAGGVIAMAALNGLASEGRQRAGFSDVRVRALDTGYAGYMHEPSDLPIIGPALTLLTELGMRIAGNIGAFDMRGNSALLGALFDRPLAGVDFHNIVANQPEGARDSHASLEDLSADATMTLARWLMREPPGPPPSDERARLLARSLRADSHFPALRAALEDAVAHGSLNLNESSHAQRVLSLCNVAMGVYSGRHADAPIDLARSLSEELQRREGADHCL